MDKEYLNILKSLDMRPKKVKMKESQEKMLLEQEDKRMDDLHAKIIKWFLENPYPTDDKVHAYAEELGIDPDKFEGHIYMVLSSFLSEGKSQGKNIKHDPNELNMGIKVEMEHTTNPILARKISLDHLVEISDYYTRLAKMEKEAGVKENVNEIFVQSSEIEALKPGPLRDIQILRLGMLAEIDASNLYEKLASLADSKDVSKLMLDISKEEKVHEGEFRSLLLKKDPEQEPAEKEGESEVDDLLK